MSQKRILDFFKSNPKHPRTSEISPTDSSSIPEKATNPTLEQDKLASVVPGARQHKLASVVPAGELPGASQHDQATGDTNASTSNSKISLSAPDKSDTAAAGTSPLPSEPFHPRNFDFPTKRFGTEGFSRSFKSAWFERWKWLHYVNDTDKALCFTCWSVVAKKLVHDCHRADGVFIRGGFSNWRKATEKFRDHEKSFFHLEAVNKIAALNSTPISALLSDAVAKEQNTGRVVLQDAFKSVHYLVR